MDLAFPVPEGPIGRRGTLEHAPPWSQQPIAESAGFIAHSSPIHRKFIVN